MQPRSTLPSNWRYGTHQFVLAKLTMKPDQEWDSDQLEKALALLDQSSEIARDQVLRLLAKLAENSTVTGIQFQE
jgi:hypothetical protein